MTKPNIKARLKVYLLQGKGITHNEAQRRWGTNRLASYIHRIRQEFLDIGLEIYCTTVTHKGHQYGIYNTRKIIK